MQTEANTFDQRCQRSASTYRSQDPEEMMRLFKQRTPLAELQRLQEMARQILAESKKQEEERITAAVSRVVAHQKTFL